MKNFNQTQKDIRGEIGLTKQFGHTIYLEDGLIILNDGKPYKITELRIGKGLEYFIIPDSDTMTVKFKINKK